MRTRWVTFVFALSLTVSLCGSTSKRNNVSQLSSLPAVAQSRISNALGHDIAGFQTQAQGDGFRVENPHHKLLTDFTSDGVNIRSGSSHWNLAFQGYGYGSVIAKSDATVPEAHLNRVEYRRGHLTEWYVNGPLGLEEGFTIDSPPGQGNKQPLTVRLRMSGEPTMIDESGKGVTLLGHDGKPALSYRGLTAYDATGKELRSWVQLQDGLLSLNVEDAGARYPVVIDPWVQLAELTASDPETYGDLGYAVAMSGNTLVVGSPFVTVGSNFQQGAAYVFVMPAGGWATMTETAKLVASDGAPGNVLGASVSINGNTIVAGAPGANVGANPLQGAAYVFVEPAGGWTNMTETAKLTASDGGLDAFLGSSVAVSGDTVAVGADGATIGSHPYQGAAYIFVEPAGGWTTTSAFNGKLTAKDGARGDQFGYSVSIDGITFVAGARYANIGTNSAQGAAYEFNRPKAGWKTTGNFNAKLTASDGAAGDMLGTAVSVNGSSVVLGAPNATIGSNPQQGAVYAFSKPTTGWVSSTETAKLTTSKGVAGDQLGYSVSFSGGTAVAGAPQSISGGNGIAYIFTRPKTGWITKTQSYTLKAVDAAPGHELGFSVAISGSTAGLGAPCATASSSDPCQGAAYVFALQ
ncbi:MAG: hypothetical protein WB952_07805 [Terriglobales bacterium]